MSLFVTNPKYPHSIHTCANYTDTTTKKTNKHVIAKLAKIFAKLVKIFALLSVVVVLSYYANMAYNMTGAVSNMREYVSDNMTEYISNMTVPEIREYISNMTAVVANYISMTLPEAALQNFEYIYIYNMTHDICNMTAGERCQAALEQGETCEAKLQKELSYSQYLISAYSKERDRVLVTTTRLASENKRLKLELDKMKLDKMWSTDNTVFCVPVPDSSYMDATDWTDWYISRDIFERNDLSKSERNIREGLDWRFERITCQPEPEHFQSEPEEEQPLL